ncbi:MAG: hypothetical protein ACRCSG_07050 [Cellulosilyticaceae bacterium]
MTKKNILDKIEEAKKEVKKGINAEEVERIYADISDNIKTLTGTIKPNTIIYLQTNLHNALSKHLPQQPEEKKNYFISFFKQAYPEGKRDKSFTWVLVDQNKITLDQIVETLKVVNTYCLKERLPKEATQDLLPMIEKVAKTDSLRHINQIRSMEGIRKALRIKIISTPRGHKITKN